MEIRKLTEDELVNYDKLVNDSLEGTIFHKNWWLSIFKDYDDSYNVDFYGVFENGEMIAGMPIPIRSKFGFKLIYHPIMTRYLGPFYIQRNEKRYGKFTREKKVNEELGKFLKRLNYLILHYTFNYNDLQPFQWNGFKIEVKYTYVLKLDNLEDVWKNMNRKRRNDINRCNSQNYHIKLSEIDKFIELNKRTMLRQKNIVFDKKLMIDIFEKCKKNNCCEIFTAYDINNKEKASLLLIWDNKRGYYMGGGIDYNSNGAMSLLIWEAIKYTKAKNLNEFDFAGLPRIHRSIEFYCRKFGGEIKPLFYIRDDSFKNTMIMKLYKIFKFGVLG